MLPPHPFIGLQKWEGKVDFLFFSDGPCAMRTGRRGLNPSRPVRWIDAFFRREALAIDRRFELGSGLDLIRVEP